MTAALLTAFQVADSGFPSGAFAYSWGLEAASEAGQVTRRTFPDWLWLEMHGRWAQFDRVVIAGAFRAGDLVAYDREVDRLFWAETLRARSAEAGQAFLAATARLGDAAACIYRAAVLEGRAEGHLPSAQGAVFRSMGLTLEIALAASAHAAAQAQVHAAVRLGLIGMLEGQRALTGLHDALSEAIRPPAPGTLPASFAPVSEIAMLRPGQRPLFAN